MYPTRGEIELIALQDIRKFRAANVEGKNYQQLSEAIGAAIRATCQYVAQGRRMCQFWYATSWSIDVKTLRAYEKHTSHRPLPERKERPAPMRDLAAQFCLEFVDRHSIDSTKGMDFAFRSVSYPDSTFSEKDGNFHFP